MEILSFFLGIVWTYTHLAEVALPLLAFCLFSKNVKFLAWAALGLGWGLAHEYLSSPDPISKNKVVTHAKLQGVVSTIPKIKANQIQFQFETDHVQDKPAQTRIWVSCYQSCPDIKVGERWQIFATLKKPKPNVLPGEMNPRFWLKSNHIHWMGVTQSKGALKLNEPTGTWRFQAFRATLSSSLESVLKNEPTLGLIQGLTLGVASHIDKSQWELFRRTGTTHLVVISGEHIGLISGFFFMLTKWAWTRARPLPLYIPATQAASVVAWTVGCFYAFLSGLGAPVERAIIGFGVLLLRYFISRRFTVWQAWRYALFLILWIEPHVVLTPGFYLSFIAVGILVLISARFPAKRIRLAIQLQFACLLGLTPLTLYAFSYASFNGFVVNLISIPLVGLIIVPAGLIGLILIQIYPWAGWLWIAKWCSGLFLNLLQALDRLSWMNLSIQVADLLSLISISLGLACLILMPFRHLYFVYGCMIILPFFPRQASLLPAQAKVTIFDVGQGLAVLVQTANHVLIYDTGGAFYQGGDWASLKVVPYLKYLHIKEISGLVISHQDLDHRGGLSTLEKSFSIGHFWVNDPSFYHRGQSCHSMETWTWDGVKFRFFSLPIQLEKRNNTCCILQIDTPYGKLLLTGDIEAKAESYLVSHYGTALKSDYLVIPHHGSQTSSSTDFVNTVHPKLGIISSGLNNRFHFPHRQTLKTYHQLHIPLKNTATQGPIQIDLKQT